MASPLSLGHTHSVLYPSMRTIGSAGSGEESPSGFGSTLQPPTVPPMDGTVQHNWASTTMEPPASYHGGKAELVHWFQSLRISFQDATFYANELVELGIDDLQSLFEDATEEDLGSMKPAHVRRVLRAVAANGNLHVKAAVFEARKSLREHALEQAGLYRDQSSSSSPSPTPDRAEAKASMRGVYHRSTSVAAAEVPRLGHTRSRSTDSGSVSQDELQRARHRRERDSWPQAIHNHSNGMAHGSGGGAEAKGETPRPEVDSKESGASPRVDVDVTFVPERRRSSSAASAASESRLSSTSLPRCSTPTPPVGPEELPTSVELWDLNDVVIWLQQFEALRTKR